MKAVYPVVISKGAQYYLVSVPDLEIDTQGTDIADAIEMARDAICIWCVAEQYAGREIPPSSGINSISHDKEDILTLVDVDIDVYRRKHEMRTIRKNLTIPSWLNEEAEKAGINFSSILQKALKEELSITE